MSARVGLGWDLHRMEVGRPLIVGGVEIPHDRGPVGHSDGDVLLHALTDALLGAAALGDIGDWFDDRDPRHAGQSSDVFVREVVAKLTERRLRVAGVDSVVILERPRLGPHKRAMRECIASLVGLQVDRVSVKAKTHERVDAIGAGDAIAAQVIVSLEAID